MILQIDMTPSMTFLQILNDFLIRISRKPFGNETPYIILKLCFIVAAVVLFPYEIYPT